jgi:hypothetical protein
MSTTDYLINGLLVALVIRQVRGRPLSIKMLCVPLVIVAVFALEYLHGLPTSGPNLVLVLIGVGAGAVLGTGAGLLTRVFRGPDGSIWSKAGVAAAVLWVVGVGSRIAFELYVTHGGEKAVERFSAAHGITNINAWVDGLILMSLVEVVCRTTVIGLRFFRMHRADAVPVASRSIMETGGPSI